MIRATCRCNDERYSKETWPTWFIAVPTKGQRVRSSNGKELYVSNVIHYEKHGLNIEAAIEIELTPAYVSAGS